MIWRVLAVWVATALGLLAAAWLIPGFDVSSVEGALAGALVLGLLNGLLWPVVVALALPLTVLTLGLGPLLLNAAMVGLAAWLLPNELSVDGVWPALGTALVVTAVNLLVTSALALDDDDMWNRRVVRRAARRSGAAPTTEPGVLFLQIDGLGHDVLRRAMRDGDAPTLARWVAEGSHVLQPWETDWSSQTGASQCGILMGSNEDMPAFRWLEKETGEVLVSNRPRCAAEIEARHSTGHGLLRHDGASRGNIFTGDAAEAVLTMSVAGRRRGRIGAGYYAYFSHPYNTSRTLLGVVGEVVREIRQAAAQRRRDVRPRVHRGGVYPLLRAFTTVVSRDVIVATLIGDMYAGRSVVYADFVGYDEVAHHSGVERHESLDALRELDRQLGRLERAAADAPRPYHLVVLSDHGQSQGATFRERYGETLADVVRRATDLPAGQQPAPSAPAGEESWGYAGAAIEEVTAGGGLVARVMGWLSRGHRTEGGDVVLGPDDAAKRPEGTVVLASGNLGLVYLTDEPGRVPLERIAERYPGLLPAVVGHPGVGFVLVDSVQHGPVVLGATGSHRLATGEVEGSDPLAPFGPRAAVHVLRTSGFPHCADLMVNSRYDEQTDEVAAFEELVGSHGGMGGEQSRPFLLHPVALPGPDGDLVGAEQVHRLLTGWLAGLRAAPVAPPDGAAPAVR